MSGTLRVADAFAVAYLRALGIDAAAENLAIAACGSEAAISSSLQPLEALLSIIQLGVASPGEVLSPTTLRLNALPPGIIQNVCEAGDVLISAAHIPTLLSLWQQPVWNYQRGTANLSSSAVSPTFDVFDATLVHPSTLRQFSSQPTSLCCLYVSSYGAQPPSYAAAHRELRSIEPPRVPSGVTIVDLVILATSPSPPSSGGVSSIAAGSVRAATTASRPGSTAVRRQGAIPPDVEEAMGGFGQGGWRRKRRGAALGGGVGLRDCCGSVPSVGSRTARLTSLLVRLLPLYGTPGLLFVLLTERFCGPSNSGAVAAAPPAGGENYDLHPIVSELAPAACVHGPPTAAVLRAIRLHVLVFVARWLEIQPSDFADCRLRRSVECFLHAARDIDPVGLSGMCSSIQRTLRVSRCGVDSQSLGWLDLEGLGKRGYSSRAAGECGPVPSWAALAVNLEPVVGPAVVSAVSVVSATASCAHASAESGTAVSVGACGLHEVVPPPRDRPAVQSIYPSGEVVVGSHDVLDASVSLRRNLDGPIASALLGLPAGSARPSPMQMWSFSVRDIASQLLLRHVVLARSISPRSVLTLWRRAQQPPCIPSGVHPSTALGALLRSGCALSCWVIAEANAAADVQSVVGRFVDLAWECASHADAVAVAGLTRGLASPSVLHLVAGRGHIDALRMNRFAALVGPIRRAFTDVDAAAAQYRALASGDMPYCEVNAAFCGSSAAPGHGDVSFGLNTSVGARGKPHRLASTSEYARVSSILGGADDGEPFFSDEFAQCPAGAGVRSIFRQHVDAAHLLREVMQEADAVRPDVLAAPSVRVMVPPVAAIVRLLESAFHRPLFSEGTSKFRSTGDSSPGRGYEPAKGDTFSHSDAPLTASADEETDHSPVASVDWPRLLLVHRAVEILCDLPFLLPLPADRVSVDCQSWLSEQLLKCEKIGGSPQGF